MIITEVEVSLVDPHKGMLAEVRVVFDGWFCVRGLRVIRAGADQVFVQMPDYPRKGKCGHCGRMVFVEWSYCSRCGASLPPAEKEPGQRRYYDIAYPINRQGRAYIEGVVLGAYYAEVERVAAPAAGEGVASA